MKKKTYIKQAAYQKVDNTRGTDIKGALNLNKEVLDTLVDKNVLGTTNCCQYFPTIPSILDSQAEGLIIEGAIPPNSFFITVNGDGEFQDLLFVYLQNGEYTSITLAP